MCVACAYSQAHGMGVQPKKQAKLHRFHAHISRADRKALARLARENERTVAAELRLAIRAHINGKKAA